ncbi:MAG: antitoxin [Desulfamplus sp.]|nr:antitoxin [Desulfamplus sp.]
MNSKLTLMLDENLIERAKIYSNKTGKSLSMIVSNYFSLIDSIIYENEKTKPTAKITNSLRGCLQNRSETISEDSYNEYLENKYL